MNDYPPIQYCPKAVDWFEQQFDESLSVEISPADLHVLADASDRIEQEQAKRIMQYGSQIISLKEQLVSKQNEIACYEYDRWIILGVTAWALGATIVAICLRRLA